MKDKIIALLRNPLARKIAVRIIIAALTAAGLVTVGPEIVDAGLVVTADVVELVG